MAEIVTDQVDWVRQQIFPWDKWADGQKWRLQQGVDFKGEIRPFQSAVHNAAIRLGLRARTRTDGKRTVVIQFYKPKPARKRA